MADRGYLAARAALALCALLAGCVGCEDGLVGIDYLAFESARNGRHGTTLLDLAFYAVDDEGQRTTPLDAMPAYDGSTYGWPAAALSPALTATALDRVQVRLGGIPGRSEALLFAFDPAARAAELRMIAAGERLDPQGAEQWDRLFADPLHATKVTLPPAVVLPYANAAMRPQPFEPLTDRAELILGAAKFAGAPSNVLAGDATGPGGAGSVKAARVYDHGACSREKKMQPSLDRQIDQGLKSLKYALASLDLGAVAKVVVHFARAAVFLDHGDPTNPTDLRDGLFLDAHATIVAPTGHPDIEVWVFVEARFDLEDGLVVLRYDTLDVQVSHGCCISFVTNDYLEAQVTAAIEALGTRFTEEGKSAQNVDLGSLFGRCDPAAADPCASARDGFDDAVRFGAARLNASREPGDPGYLSDDDIDALTATADDERNWTCAERYDGQSTCSYFVPIKRLNVYPDAVEAVFFDGKETDNPAYAAWVATHAVDDAKLKKARKAMCSWSQKHQGDWFYTRPFAWTRR